MQAWALRIDPAQPVPDYILHPTARYHIATVEERIVTAVEVEEEEVPAR